MSNYTVEQIDEILISFENLLVENGAYSVELGFDKANEDLIRIYHADPQSLRSQVDASYQATDGTEIPIRIVRSDPIELLLGVEGQESKLPYPETDAHIGMGGTKLRNSKGFYGTASMSVSNINIGMGSQRCRGSNVITSNGHVVDRRNMRMSSESDKYLGNTQCLFDLDRRNTLDYGHLRWTDNYLAANKFKVFDSRNGNSITIAGAASVKRRRSVHKQGAGTGWTSGSVRARARIRMRQHGGTFPCWRASYDSTGGDSGSPILRSSRGRWYWAGVHFPSYP